MNLNVKKQSYFCKYFRKKAAFQLPVQTLFHMLFIPKKAGDLSEQKVL